MQRSAVKMFLDLYVYSTYEEIYAPDLVPFPYIRLVGA